jgi:hypothetical protein
MYINEVANFLSGGAMMANLLISFMFARYWIRTADRLFLFFSVAFGLLCLERILLLAAKQAEPFSWVYLIRLVAFLLVITGIVAKNRQQALNTED